MKLKLFFAAATIVAALTTACPPRAGAAEREPFWKRIFGRTDKRRDIPTTVAGVRGIDEAGAAGDSTSRDYEALAKIDGLAFPKGELDKFIADGGLK